MSNVVGSGIARILVDSDGDALSTSDGKLNVNAGLTVAGDLNIGNVDVVSVPSPLSTAGDGSRGGALRVTMANDSSPLTVSAGTNLNTSALALESGGNLAATVTALEKIDDIQDVIYIDDADWSNGSSKHILVGGVYASGGMSITDGDVSPLLLGVQGGLIIDVLNGGVLESTLDGVETHLAGIETAVELMSPAYDILGTTTYTEASNKCVTIGVVRNNILEALASTDNEIAPLQVNAKGALYVTGGEVENAAVQSEPMLMGGRYDSSARTLGSGDAGAIALNPSGHVIMDVVNGGVLESVLDGVEGSLTTISNWDIAHDDPVNADGIQIMGEAKIIDGSALPNSVVEGDAVRIATTRSGILYTALVDQSGQRHAIVVDDVIQVSTPAMMNVGGEYRSSNVTYTNGDATILQSDINGTLKTTHNISAMVSDINNEVGTSVEDIDDGSSVVIKRIDLFADPANTGYIWVGDASVANDGTGGGVRLGPGDFYSMDINNLDLVHVAATVNNENIMYTYYT